MAPGLHALLAGAWIGCVLVEALFERALLGKGREQELILARLHWKVDLLVEAPLLLAVAVTGALNFAGRPVDALLGAKLAFAAVAILANLYCIWLVKVRLDRAEAGDWAGFEKADHIQHKAGALVLLALLGAAGIGLAI